MIWNKPRNVWQWMLLLVPAFVAITAVQTAQWWLGPPPIDLYSNGMVVQKGLVNAIREVSITFWVVAAGSSVIALVLSQGAPFGQRIANWIFFLLCLLVVNGFVAFAGCATINTLWPGPASSTPSR